MMKYLSSSICRLLSFLVILLLGGLISVSCSGPKDHLETPVVDKQLAANRVAIRTLTDKVLVAFAARKYEDLADYIEPGRFPLAKDDKRMIGLMTAKRLLGSSAATVVIQQWDISTIKIAFENDSQQATAKITVWNRKGLYSRTQIDQFVFRFQFFKELDQWRLYVP